MRAIDSSKSIYTASKVTHADKWRALRAMGANVLSTWIDEAGDGETDDWTDLWGRCVAEAGAADVCLVYVEPGEVLKGALVEMGAAIASGRPVYWIGPVGNYTATAHAAVTICETVDEALVAAGVLR